MTTDTVTHSSMVEWRCKETGALVRRDSDLENRSFENYSPRDDEVFRKTYGLSIQDYAECIRSGQCDLDRKRVLDLVKKWDQD